MEVTVALDPNHGAALLPLAFHYALAMLQPGPGAARAEAALDGSKNVWVLGNAAYMLQSQYNQSLQNGVHNSRAAQLTERYFLRAKAIDPNLERSKILPQLDMRELERSRQTELQGQQQANQDFAEQATKIVRLPLSAFPHLPPVIASVLRARNCTVPQPAFGNTPRNVIQGQFFAKGQIGWAVLCSVKGSTALLAFRDADDTKPETLNTAEDSTYLQGLGEGKTGYSRQVNSASRNTIVRYYRAYGGTKPPPLDHEGIDDAFLEKASTILYFHRGKWLPLQGAD